MDSKLASEPISKTKIDGVDFKDPEKSLETKLGGLAISELRGIGEPGTLSLKGFESLLDDSKEPEKQEKINNDHDKITDQSDLSQVKQDEINDKKTMIMLKVGPNQTRSLDFLIQYLSRI